MNRSKQDSGGGAETDRLVQQLPIHQIELELQNEELRLARAHLEASLARYSDLYDFAPVGYVTLGRDGTVAEVNLTGARLLGVERKSLIKRRLGLFFRDSDRQVFSDFLEHVFNGVGKHVCDVWLRDGEPRALSIEGSCVGEGTECRAVLQDVTERRRAEDALRLQSAALHAASHSIMITDREGTIQFVNEAFTSLTGFSADEAIGKNPRELVRSGVHDRAFFHELWASILSDRVWVGEITNRRKDGTHYPEERTITPVKDDTGRITHFVAVGRDLAGQHALEAQLVQAQKMEVLGRLAGGVAHDFNNLLTVINGSARLARDDLGPSNPAHEILSDVIEAGDRAAGLTKQLLAFSRRQPMAREPVDLGALLERVKGMLVRVIGEDVRLVVDVGSVPAVVMTDPGQLERVVLNLAVNARDAMPNGGTFTLSMRTTDLGPGHAAEGRSHRGGPHVVLTAQDTGVGMDEATRSRVFEPFFTTKDQGKGTGLGLSSAFGIIEQSGGRIEVSTKLGHGTTFTIYLPLAVRRAAPEVSFAPPPALVGSETVLVVEDEPGVRALAARILRRAGYRVLVAGDGPEALEVLKREGEEVHLMVTDLIMPGMSGQELALHVEQTHPGIKVLYTSGYSEDARFGGRTGEGDARFLGKPYDASQLAGKVRAVLDAPPGG